MTQLPSPFGIALLLAISSHGCAEEAQLAGAETQAHKLAEDDDAGADMADKTSDSTSGSASCKPSKQRCDEFDATARPLRRSEHSAVYDQERRQMVLFGGTDNIPINCALDGTSQYNSDVWIYDDACGMWEQHTGGPERTRHAAAIGDDTMWVFGGRFRAADSGNYTLYNDLFAFDLESHEWRTVEAGNAPPVRANTAMTWDKKRKRLWLFDGNASVNGLTYQPLNDLWFFDPEVGSWQSVPITAGPNPRLFHALIYDAKRDWLVTFSGGDQTAFDNFPNYYGDLWAYDLAAGQWIELAAQGAGPRGRFWAQIVHDTDEDEYVIFGGHDPGTLLDRDETLGNLNDSWTFDIDDRSWTQVTTGDTFNVGPRGFCDFSPDFAVIDSDLPERRDAHTMVWSEACGHALMFGGKTDCGSADDIWTYNAKDGWQEQLSAREGEVCLRWREDPSKCVDMCF